MQFKTTGANFFYKGLFLNIMNVQVNKIISSAKATTIFEPEQFCPERIVLL